MSFQLTILGSSSALPTSKRFSTAQVLNVHERFFLIDCGEGTQMQLRRSKVGFGRINHIFISHIHGDHIFGLFGLLSSFNLLGRRSDLNIYADPKLETILNSLSPYFFYDLKYKIVYHYLDAKTSTLIYEDKLVEVHSIPLKHTIPTCGFLFKEKEKPLNIKKDAIDRYNISIRDIVKIKNGEDYVTDKGDVILNKELTILPPPTKSYAYCSDTAYAEKIIPLIKDVDLLYHETTFMNDMAKRAKKTGHSTTIQAATIAQKANAKKLIIGHFSSRYNDLQPLHEEALSVFENTIIANDGESYVVGE